jgi:diacylglycerol kinase (ATP)
VARDWVVVFNAASGSADDDAQEAIVASLASEGRVHMVAPASRESFDDEVRSAAHSADVVVAAGGDGTMNATLNALSDRLPEITLALVPMGTGNDLARTLGLADDPVEVANGLKTGVLRRLDVGRASGPGVERLFLNACMGGFPVEANEAIDEDTKKKLGPLAFWLGGARALKELSKSTMSMNATKLEDCVAAGVGNGRTCGGGTEVWPSAEPDDGSLNGCLLAASNVAQAVSLAARVARGSHESTRGVRTATSRRIEFEARPDIEFNVDGELIGLRSPAVFEIVSSVSFLVPK